MQEVTLDAARSADAKAHAQTLTADQAADVTVPAGFPRPDGPCGYVQNAVPPTITGDTSLGGTVTTWPGDWNPCTPPLTQVDVYWPSDGGHGYSHAINQADVNAGQVCSVSTVWDSGGDQGSMQVCVTVPGGPTGGSCSIAELGRPYLDGLTQVGANLHMNGGSWQPSCGGGLSQVDIVWSPNGSHGSDYVVQSSDQGHNVCATITVWDFNNAPPQSDTACLGIPAPPPPPPTVSLTADATLVAYNGSTTLRWSTTNASTCLASWTASTATAGAQTIGPLTATKTYSISCAGPSGTASASVTVSVGAPPVAPTVTLTADATSVAYNGSTTLRWNSTNAFTCSATWTTSTSTSGAQALGPLTATRTYSITCTGSGGSTSANVTVTVAAANDFSLAVNPTTVIVAQAKTGAATIATALTTGTAQTVTLTIIGLPGGASATFAPSTLSVGSSSTLTLGAGTAAPGNYPLTITAGGASATHTVPLTLSVTATPVPTVALSANPGSVSWGTDTVLSWTTTNAASCSAPWTASTSTQDSQEVGPLTTTTNYSITCTGAGGSATQSLQVSVTGTALPVVAQGRLTDASGNGVKGNVRLLIEPDLQTTGASGSATQVASVLSDSNGNFTVWLDPNNSAVQASTINGWVNLEVVAYTSSYETVWGIPRRWVNGIWSDTDNGLTPAAPAPLNIQMSNGQRFLQAVTTVTALGSASATDSVATTSIKPMTVGEFHDVQDESGRFDYAVNADTTVDAGISFDAGKTWKFQGTFQVTRTIDSSFGTFLKFQANVGTTVYVPTLFKLVHQTVTACYTLCPGGSAYPPTQDIYEWIPIKVAGTLKTGDDVRSFDHHCNDQHYGHIDNILPNSGADRHGGKAFKWTAGVTLSFAGIATVSLGTSSGFSANHGWSVATGSNTHATTGGYHWCGTDDVPTYASRDFFGNTSNAP
jgi:hypothetical protein